jgi:AcrR family transcriptional regulator
MAYEVITRRGKAAYRYRVEYVPGPLGARHTRWYYLGVVQEDGATVQAGIKHHSGATTADRLLDAFERLLTRNDFHNISASAIALEAGTAHGTFYRHFKSKREVLVAAITRASERAGSHARLAASDDSRDQERRRLENWMRTKLLSVSEFPTLWLAWSTLAQSDAEIARLREDLRERKRAILGVYLAQLHALGHSHLEDADNASRVIFSLILGVLQSANAQGILAPEIVALSCRMVDRMVFASLAATL